MVLLMSIVGKRCILILILVMLLAGCAGPGPAASINKQAAPIGLVKSPAPTASRTPFQPIPPTSTHTPLPSITPSITATFTLTPTPTPTETPLPFTPTAWYFDLDLPDDQETFLVLGSDERPGGGYRTDVILLVIVNPSEGTASVVSFPRDLYVFIPYYGMNRINTAMYMGGFSGLADTFEYNFGIRPHHYVMTNFNSFMDIIDTLDGIDVHVRKELVDTCKLPIAYGDYCIIQTGVQPMNGETALWYVRSRKSTNDFDRNRRQQEVLLALFNRFLTIDGLSRAPDLFEIMRDNVETDLNLDDVLPAPRLAKDGHIRFYSVGQSEVWNYVAEGGAMVLLPNQEAIYSILQQATTP
jgi:LCP family protein required for cell wall assembly